MKRFCLIALIALMGCSPTDVTSPSAQQRLAPEAEDHQVSSAQVGSKGAEYFGVVQLGEKRTPMLIALKGERLFLDQNFDGTLSVDEELKSEGENRRASFSCDVKLPNDDDNICKCSITFYNWEKYCESMKFEDLAPRIMVTFPNGRRFGAWGDQRSKLTFADSELNAPEIQMGACAEKPLTMGFEVPKPLRPKAGGLDISAAVGIRNDKPGTFAWLGYRKTIPDDVWPDAEFTFSDGERTETVKAKLDRRC